MKRRLVLSVAGGCVLFLWGFLSWAVLPWHMTVANKFTDEAAVSQVLRENAPERGVYYLPFSPQDHGPDQVGAFVNVLPQGTEMQMGAQMARGLLIQIVSAFLVLSLLSTAMVLSVGARIGSFTLVGLIIGFVSHATYWNWFGFTAAYTIVIILDSTIGWTLAGLAVAKFMDERGT